MNKDILNISSISHETSNNSSSFEQPRDADDDDVILLEPAADENNAGAKQAQKPKRKRGKDTGRITKKSATNVEQLQKPESLLTLHVEPPNHAQHQEQKRLRQSHPLPSQSFPPPHTQLQQPSPHHEFSSHQQTTLEPTAAPGAHAFIRHNMIATSHSMNCLDWGGPTTGVGGNDYNQLKVAALEAKNQMLEGKLEKQELKTQIMALSIQKAHLKAKSRELEEKMKKGQTGSNGNRWNGSNPNVQIFPNGLSVNNAQLFMQHVFAEQGFTISAGAGAGSRSGDKFYRTREVATYYEVTQTSAGDGFNVGFSTGFIPEGKSVGECPNSYALQDSDLCHLSGRQHQFHWPFGATKPESKGLGVDGCGLLLTDNKLAIFFTINGILIGGPILISTKLDRLYPTVAIQGNVSVEANFGENLGVKPFKFEIDKYLDSVFK